MARGLLGSPLGDAPANRATAGRGEGAALPPPVKTAPTAAAALTAALALSATACGEPALQRVADAANRAVPAATPSPLPQGPTPTPTPAGVDRLVLTGDVAFEDLSPEVVLTRRGELYDLELRHREPGSAAPDTTLFFQGVPATAGTYAVRAPRPGGGPGGGVAAFLTSRTERVGSMKDFTDDVRGSLTIREESPGVLAGEFTVAVQETPPPPPVVIEGVPTPAPSVGTMPTPPPARVEASGGFLVLLAEARAAPSEPPPLPTPAIAVEPAPSPTPVAPPG